MSRSRSEEIHPAILADAPGHRSTPQPTAHAGSTYANQRAQYRRDFLSRQFAQRENLAERRSYLDTAHPLKGIGVEPLFVFRPERLSAVAFRSVMGGNFPGVLRSFVRISLIPDRRLHERKLRFVRVT